MNPLVALNAVTLVSRCHPVPFRELASSKARDRTGVAIFRILRRQSMELETIRAL